MFLWILGHIHPANLPIRSANHQHHRIFLRRQILDVARFFDLEDFASVLARFQIRIARLQLQIDALPACLPVVVFEFDLAINAPVNAPVGIRYGAENLASLARNRV